MLSQSELLEKVKQGLSIVDTFNDAQLTIKVMAVKQYCINGGVSETVLDTELGYALITLGVTDIWNLASGEVKFSGAFNMILTQLKAMSLE